MLLLAWPFALAREATLDMGLGQYAHRVWTIGEGGINAPIHAIAQTPDGYLWLGSQIGLWRFDGIRAIPWHAPQGQHLPGKWIQSLLATRDGTLWIGTDGGLASWRTGVLTEYPTLGGLDVLALLVDREGTVWAGTESRATSTGRLCAIRNRAVHCYGGDGSLGARIYDLYEDSDGHLWFTSSSGVWRWRPGRPKLFPMLDSITGYFQSLTSGTDGGMLVSAHDGLQTIVRDEVRAFPLPEALPQGPPPWVLTGRDGALWIGTVGDGLRYLQAGRMDAFRKSDGLSGDQVMRLFEDREGDVWVATKSGLDEFWKIAAARLPGKLGDGSVTSVLADIDGGIWFTMQTGLYRWKDGEMTVYLGHARNEMPEPAAEQPAAHESIVTGLPPDTSGPLYQDHRGRIWLGSPSGLGYLQNGRFASVPGMPRGELTCITEDDRGNLWVSHRRLGLFRISPTGQVKRFAWAELHIGETWNIVFDPARRGLWLGSILGQIDFFADQQIRASYTVSGNGKRAIRDLRLDPDGTLWAATEGGLVGLSHGHLATLNSENGLPCDIIHATIDDDAGSVWIYTACGLVRVARADLDAWNRGTPGRHAFRLLILDASDGVRSSDVWHFSPKIAKSPDGRLWFANSAGPMTVDPRRLLRNALPPPVQIEQVTADRKSYGASPRLVLPPLVHEVEIDYTALSLAAPEKNMFRYQLAGHDRDWQSVGNRRQAFYNDLPPGNYRFRVIASNNSGVWNRQGAELDFSIAPAFWQTTWFRALCAATLVFLLWALYQLRLHQMARAFNTRLEERVAERTRIARDLHDTLLQSFQGLLLRFQTVRELLVTRPADALNVLESAISQTAQAITEGRNAVQGLRASTIERDDLAVTIRTLGEALVTEAGGHTPIGLAVEVEGVSRALHPIVRDEVFRIASEAVRNACSHAVPQHIEVELRYDERQFRLRVRDDGKGFDPQIPTKGRPGHFGLHGMHERAHLVGGKLTVWTARGTGTEIELGIPATYAYATVAAPRRGLFAERRVRKARRRDR